MNDLLRSQQLLSDFEKFESTYLDPYVPDSVTNVDLLKSGEALFTTKDFNHEIEIEINENYKRSWLQEMEQGCVSNSLHNRLPQHSVSENQINSMSKLQLLDEFDAYPLHLVTEDSIDASTRPLAPGDDTYCGLMIDDFLSFDTSILDMIDFEIPTGPSQKIDTMAYVDKAANAYGEDFAKKVKENLDILVQAMNKLDKCCNDARGERAVCCNGKCWGYVEKKWREMKNMSKKRGRKRNGTKVSPEQVELRKQYQKIRNRLAAARAYNKEKDYVRDLQLKVQHLRAENKIRRNLVKVRKKETPVLQFLERSLQLPPERRSLRPTTSGLLLSHYT